MVLGELALLVVYLPQVWTRDGLPPVPFTFCHLLHVEDLHPAHDSKSAGPATYLIQHSGERVLQLA